MINDKGEFGKVSKIRKKKIKKTNILLGFICILLAVLLGFILVTSYKSEQKESRHLYLLEAQFRYDGSSKFAKGHQWGFFPSLSAGWRVSEEPFFKSIDALKFVNQLKLRASYGVLISRSLRQCNA